MGVDVVIKGLIHNVMAGVKELHDLFRRVFYLSVSFPFVLRQPMEGEQLEISTDNVLSRAVFRDRPVPVSGGLLGTVMGRTGVLGGRMSRNCPGVGTREQGVIDGNCGLDSKREQIMKKQKGKK